MVKTRRSSKNSTETPSSSNNIALGRVTKNSLAAIGTHGLQIERPFRTFIRRNYRRNAIDAINEDADEINQENGREQQAEEIIHANAQENDQEPQEVDNLHENLQENVQEQHVEGIVPENAPENDPQPQIEVIVPVNPQANGPNQQERALIQRNSQENGPGQQIGEVLPENPQPAGERNPRNYRKQPTTQVRMNGIHMAYYGDDLGRCRLQGCERRTKNICAYANCGMRLCAQPAKGAYTDGKINKCSAEKRDFINQLEMEQKSCFIIYHNMVKPLIDDEE